MLEEISLVENWMDGARKLKFLGLLDLLALTSFPSDAVVRVLLEQPP